MKFLCEKYCVLKNFCNFVADLVKTISRHIRNDKKRYAYLVNWKPRKFLKRTRVA